MNRDQRRPLSIVVPVMSQACSGPDESNSEVSPWGDTSVADASVLAGLAALDKTPATIPLTRQRSSGEASSLSCATVRSQPSDDSAHSRAFFPPENDSARSRGFFPP